MRLGREFKEMLESPVTMSKACCQIYLQTSYVMLYK